MKNPLTTLSPRFRSRAASPLSALADIENEMARWMRGSLAWPEEADKFDFSPACNFKENTNEYVVQFDIPGVKKDAVKIEIENNRLTVSGERNETKEEKDARYFITETCCGSFMRSFSLPTAVDENKIEASYDNGVLTIAVPKLHATKAKEVKIQ